MKHIFLEKENFTEKNTVTIEGDDYFHLYRSLRKNKKEIITAIYNLNKYLLKNIYITKNKAIFEIIEKISLKKQPFEIDFIIPTLKEKVMPLLIEKLTEVGVNNIFIYKFVYSVITEYNENKIQRYKKISRLASQQSGRISIPQITFIKNRNELQNLFNNYNKRIILFENAQLNVFSYIFELYNNFHQITKDKKNKITKNLISSSNKKDINISKLTNNYNEPYKILIISGPEGSFHNDEITFFQKNNFNFINLGNNILKAETAPIIITSIFYNFFFDIFNKQYYSQENKHN